MKTINYVYLLICLFIFVTCNRTIDPINKTPIKIWDKTLGGTEGEYITSIVATSDGGYVMLGTSNSNTSGDKTQESKGGQGDYWIVKINSVGQKVWDKTFGGNEFEYTSKIIATSDGGFVILGSSNSGNSGDKTEVNKGKFWDYWVVKINSNGQKVWDKTLGGSNIDNATSIIATSDGGFIVTGYSNSDITGDKSELHRGDFDYWVVKISGNGQRLWDKTFGGKGADRDPFIASTIDGGYILAGISDSAIGGDKTENNKNSSTDFWLVKIDGMGQKIWDKTLGGDKSEYVSSIISDNEGNIIVNGYSDSGVSGDKSETNKGNLDFWVVKINEKGQKIWDKSLGGDNLDFGNSITQTSDKGFIIAGTSSSNKSGDKTQESDKDTQDFWVIKIDNTGNKVWDKTLGGNENSRCNQVITNSDGSFVLAGSTSSGISRDKTELSKGGMDYWLVKLGFQ
jgi:hypothetical protein